MACPVSRIAVTEGHFLQYNAFQLYQSVVELGSYAINVCHCVRCMSDNVCLYIRIAHMHVILQPEVAMLFV